MNKKEIAEFASKFPTHDVWTNGSGCYWAVLGIDDEERQLCYFNEGTVGRHHVLPRYKFTHPSEYREPTVWDVVKKLKADGEDRYVISERDCTVWLIERLDPSPIPWREFLEWPEEPKIEKGQKVVGWDGEMFKMFCGKYGGVSIAPSSPNIISFGLTGTRNFTHCVPYEWTEDEFWNGLDPDTEKKLKESVK